MKKASLLNDVLYRDDKPMITVLMESDFTKEIRIVFKENQHMKEHKTPFPIVIELVEGKLDFGTEGIIHSLEKGDLICLNRNVPHDLKALSDSIVRLTLLKSDSVERVKEVADN